MVSAPSEPGSRSSPSSASRVRKRAEYLEIQSGGQRVSGDCLVFILLRRPAGSPLRLGITASRKIGNAVQRNRARRLVREAFRAVFEQLPPAVDIVVIVRRPLGERKLQAVLDEWLRALPRIRRFAGP
ncbi:MAG: ribonuclease P protein component [Myxococcales bacterium]|nr:MAG: ribonuclease P protein component [Myxococcales bacterium]